MKAKNTNKPDYYALYDDKVTQVQQKIVQLTDHPDNEIIHAVRTSIRRLESLYRIFPKPCKTVKTENIMHQIMQFFRFNSHTRDCDVMVEKLMQHGLEKDSHLVLALFQSRKAQARATMEQAKKIVAITPASLKRSATNPATKLKSEIAKLLRQFLRLLPVVLKDESKVDALHDMRKAAKKLYYLLELDPILLAAPQMVNIKYFQRLTGDIHDSDVLEEFLQEHRGDHANTQIILEQEKITRHASYRELCGLLRDKHWSKLGDTA